MLRLEKKEKLDPKGIVIGRSYYDLNAKILLKTL
jgi:hypothetical protein